MTELAKAMQGAWGVPPIYIHPVMLKYLKGSVNYFGDTFVKYVNRILGPPLGE